MAISPVLGKRTHMGSPPPTRWSIFHLVGQLTSHYATVQKVQGSMSGKEGRENVSGEDKRLPEMGRQEANRGFAYGKGGSGHGRGGVAQDEGVPSGDNTWHSLRAAPRCYCTDFPSHRWFVAAHIMLACNAQRHDSMTVLHNMHFDTVEWLCLLAFHRHLFLCSVALPGWQKYICHLTVSVAYFPLNKWNKI